MTQSESHPSSEWVESAYEILKPYISGEGEGVSRDRAVHILLELENFTNETGDAQYALERMVNTGLIYEVDGELRITASD